MRCLSRVFWEWTIRAVETETSGQDIGRVILIPRLNHEKASEGAILLFSFLSWVSAQTSKDSGLSNGLNDWFGVYSKALKKKFSSDYCRLIEEAIELGWIIRPRKYSNSATSQDGAGFPKAIKITDEAISSGLIKITVQDNSPAWMKMSDLEDVEFVDGPDPEVEHTLSEVKHVGLRKGVMGKIDREYKRRIHIAKANPLPRKRIKALRKVEKWRMHCYVTATAVIEKEWWVKRCIGLRVHTPITSMPKFLRNSLLYRGQALVELDISNSQPAFFGALLTWLSQTTACQIKEMLRESDARPRKKGKKMRRIVSDKEYRAAYGKHMTYLADPEEPDSREVRPTKTSEWIKYQSQNVSESTYERSLDRRVTEIQEALQGTRGVQQYIKDVASGQFYETIMGALNIPSERRPEVKEEVLKAFYQRLKEQRGQEPSEIGREIKQRYAAAYAVMDAFKKETHAAFAITMQGQESQAMQSEEFKAMHAIMIHDAVLVTEDKAEEALKQLGKQLQEAGVKALIQIERGIENEQESTEEMDELLNRIHSRSNSRKHINSHIQNDTLRTRDKTSQLSQSDLSPTLLYVAGAKLTGSRPSRQLRTITPKLSWERGVYLSASSRNELVAPKTRPPP